MGSLASADQLDKVRGHVDDAVGKGAEVLAGGRARPDLGPYFYEPTLLAGVTDEHGLCRDETFGPVAARVPLRRSTRWWPAPTTATTASTRASGRATAGRGREIAARIEAGTVNVNEAYAADLGLGRADGRLQESGIGRRHGRPASSSTPRRRRWPRSSC